MSIFLDYVGSITVKSREFKCTEEQMKVEIFYKRGNPVIKIYEKKKLPKLKKTFDVEIFSMSGSTYKITTKEETATITFHDPVDRSYFFVYVIVFS
jgi:hypothetical protein